MERNNNLTYRQQRIYDYLLKCYKEGNNNFICKLEIADAIGLNINKHQTRLLRAIEAEVRAINYNNSIEKIIVSSAKGYKIGTKEEVENYIKHRYSRDGKSMRLNHILTSKAKLNHQLMYDIYSNELHEIEVY